jgi:hypothetical protein
VRFGGWPLPAQREREGPLSDSAKESGEDVPPPARPAGLPFLASGLPFCSGGHESNRRRPGNSSPNKSSL